MKIIRLCEKLLMSALFSLVIKTALLARTNINKTESVIKPLNDDRAFDDWMAEGSTGDLQSKPFRNSSGENLNIVKCPQILRNNSCHGHTRRWIRFYLKIGGWIMLSVITVGLFVLISTHILSKRSMNNPRLERRQRTSIVEAMAKKKFIDI